jgi:hypothetical protein
MGPPEPPQARRPLREQSRNGTGFALHPRNRMAQKKCIVCGAAFFTGVAFSPMLPGRRHPKSKTCSEACTIKWKWMIGCRKRKTANAQKRYRCVACGKTYKAAKRRWKVTCSEQCENYHRRDVKYKNRERQRAKGNAQAFEARRRASGYMKNYKRAWRRRRAEAEARLELMLITHAALSQHS